MCLPAAALAPVVGAQMAGTLATIGQVASLAMSVYGAYSESKAQKDQANYQAAVSRNNAIIANRNAKAITEQGEKEAQRYRSRVRQMQADQTVGLAGQGVDVTEGTSVDLLADTAELGEFDVQTIKSNAEKEAYKAKVQGMNYQAEAGLYKTKAGSYNPMFSAGTTLLSKAGPVADRWASTRSNSFSGVWANGDVMRT